MGGVTYATPNERQKVDADFKKGSEFESIKRIELSVGFVFPKIKSTKKSSVEETAGIIQNLPVVPEIDSTLGERARVII